MERGPRTLEDMGVTPSFWKGKRVFLTGHTGFKGSWLSIWLTHMGATVTGYALPAPTTPSLFELASIASHIHHVEGDIRNAEALIHAMQAAAPDIVIHMAAQPLVRYSYDHPVETFSVNVLGTVNLFEAVRKTASVRAVVNVTTDKCYDNREWIWGYRENEALGGADPYSSSKACSELVTSSYRRSFFEPEGRVFLASARAGNVIGGGDWAADRLIPDAIRALQTDSVVRIRNPHAIRPWQHVLEPLSGYLMIAERLFEQGSSFAEAWNFGPHDQDARPVSWVVSQVVTAWGSGRWVIDDGDHPHEAHYLKLDSSKARHQLGWQPRLSLSDALTLTVDWYRWVQNQHPAWDAVINNIQKYSE